MKKVAGLRNSLAPGSVSWELSTPRSSRVIEAAIVEYRPGDRVVEQRILAEAAARSTSGDSLRTALETYQAGEVIPPAVEGEFLARGFIRDPATGISTWRVSRVRLTDDIAFAQAYHRYHSNT